MNQINIAGEKILDIMMTIGYWVTLIAGVGAVINSIAKKDVKTALRQAITYGVAFGSLFILRWMLDLIQGLFA